MNITSNARVEIQRLVGEGGYFCPYALGNSLEGFQYGVCLDKHPRECDIIIEENGLKILLDPISYQQLKDAEIDYQNKSIVISI